MIYVSTREEAIEYLQVAREVNELVLVDDPSVEGNHVTLLVIDGVTCELVLGQSVIISTHICEEKQE